MFYLKLQTFVWGTVVCYLAPLSFTRYDCSDCIVSVAHQDGIHVQCPLRHERKAKRFIRNEDQPLALKGKTSISRHITLKSPIASIRCKSNTTPLSKPFAPPPLSQPTNQSLPEVIGNKQCNARTFNLLQIIRQKAIVTSF